MGIWQEGHMLSFDIVGIAENPTAAFRYPASPKPG
jgi:hypothetical protein